MAFGLGLSYATEVPAIEVDNKGSSENTLFYWTFETEFGGRESGRSVFWRLHHRSSGFGLLGEVGGFNAMVLGVRWQL